jgi:hypothetical protein
MRAAPLKRLLACEALDAALAAFASVLKDRD